MYEDGKLGTVVYAESEYLHCEKTPEEYKPYADPDYWRAHLPAIRYLTHNLGPLLYILSDEVETVSCYVPDFDQNKYKSEKGVGIALFKTKKGAVIRIFICFGAYVGYRGMVREIVTELAKNFRTDFQLVATGGFARWVLKDIGLPFVIDPTLTLHGAGWLAERMNGGEK
jgi:hypothetical protein